MTDRMTKAEAQKLAKHVISMAPDFIIHSLEKWSRGNWWVWVKNGGLVFPVKSKADWKRRCDDQLFY